MHQMVVASYCETLRILCNMNFNVPLYETWLYRSPKTIGGIHQLYFTYELIQHSVGAVLKYYEDLWVTKFGQKLQSFVGQSSIFCQPFSVHRPPQKNN
jgi:hypothetical protein